MRQPYNRGFVLPLITWALAIFLLALTGLSGWMAIHLQRTVANSERFWSRVEEHNLLQTIKYKLAVTAPGVGGILWRDGQSLQFDGRPYRLASGGYFSLLDAANLYNVNTASRSAVITMLQFAGVPDQNQISLADSLLDYTDEDDDRRVAGAERFDYEVRGLIPPGNHFLPSRMQVLDVLGWDALAASGAYSKLREATSAWGGRGTNLNTASRQTLLQLPWLSAADVDILLRERQARPFAHLADFEKRVVSLAVSVSDTDYAFNRSSFIRLNYWAGENTAASEYDIRLTPRVYSLAPWQIKPKLIYRKNLDDRENSELVEY